MVTPRATVAFGTDKSTSALPMPFCSVTSNGLPASTGRSCASAAAVIFDLMRNITASNAVPLSSAGSPAASMRTVRGLLPATRKPRAFIAVTCSALASKAVTLATDESAAANSPPIAPQPTMRICPLMESRWLAWAPGSSRRRFELALERFDQPRNRPVVRCDLGQLLCILQSGADISGIAIERDKSEQGIAICRMLAKILLEHRNRIVDAARGVKPDCVDISILRLIGRQLGRAVKFGKRFVTFLLADKRQSNGIVQACIARCVGGSRAQQRQSFGFAPQSAIQIRKVDRRRRKLRVKAPGRHVFS